MAVTQIDIFSFTGSVSAEIYRIFFDDGNNIFSVVYSGTDGLLSEVTEAQRGKAPGEVISLGKAASLSYPFAYLVDTPVLPDECDIAISAIPTNETSQGANNGSVTVDCTSSYSNKEVSINNINWFASPHTFINLDPDNYTAYARDSNACIASIQFAIEAFENPIEGGFDGGLPQVKIGNNISRWNAVFNPVVINFQNTPDPSKKNFRYEIEITSGTTVITGTWSPDLTGKTRADISGYLKTLVNANDDFKYDTINYRDLNRSASFTIRYRQIWDGDASVWYNAPQPLYVTYSAMQLGDKYGGNMGEYVPFLNEPNYDLKAKFLTKFEEPTAWVGLPFDTSFILSEDVVTSEIKLRTISLDVNGNPIASGVINSFLLNNDAGYILGNDLSRLIIQQGALPPVSDDGIFEDLGINRLMLAGPPAQGVEYFQIQLYTGTDESPNYITQALKIKVNIPCKDPFVYVKWINSLGGWDYWRFGKNQIISMATANDIIVDRNVFDWENGDTIADIIKKSAVENIRAGAIVGKTKIEGLRQIVTSPKVMMLVNPNPYKWHTVIVNAGNFDIKQTKFGTSEIRLTFNLPERNIQQQ